MINSKYSIDKKTLEKYFLDDLLPTNKIAEIFHVKNWVIVKLIKEYNLVRDSNKVRGKSVSKTYHSNFEELISKINYDDIYTKYIVENMSHKDIQKIYNITSYTLDKILNYYNIHKSKSQASSISFKTKYEKHGGKELYNKYMSSKQKKTIIDKYGSLDNYYDIRNNKAVETFKINWGVDHPMKNKNHRESIKNNGFKSSLEHRFEEFLSNNNFDYKSHYVISKDNLIHEFDFAVFKDNKLAILIDCDGIFYHHYNIDENGQTNCAPGDEYRMLLVPDKVKFLVCLEKNEEEAYRELFTLYNASFDDYVNDVFSWCRKIDFPYPIYSEKLIYNSYKNLCNYSVDNFKMNARPGMKVVKHYHKSIYKANKKGKKSPFDAWNNDKLLLKCIKNRIIYKGNSLDASRVLAGFSASAIAPCVSVFNPFLAKYIIKKYLDNYKTIFDPCSGYSGRLLGTISLNKQYIGQDINEETIYESKKLIEDLNLNNCQVTCTNSLETMGTYDCLFTCPPYGDEEHWNQDIEVLSCDQWIDTCLTNYICNRYVFVVNKTTKYEKYIAEKIVSKSHFGETIEYIIVIDK